MSMPGHRRGSQNAGVPAAWNSRTLLRESTKAANEKMHRVQQLTYQVSYGPFVTVPDGLVQSISIPAMRIEISGSVVDVFPVDDLATEDGARELVESHLRAWEVAVGSKNRWPVFSFQFRGSLIARDDGLTGVSTQFGIPIEAIHSIAFTQLPQPPERSINEPWAEGIWAQVQQFREGKARLVAAAYMCLTILEASTDGQRQPHEHKRSAVTRLYGLDETKLKKLGELTAVSDVEQGRKIGQGRPGPLSPEELQFIEAAMYEMLDAAVRFEGLA
jgi:hypothetical protein